MSTLADAHRDSPAQEGKSPNTVVSKSSNSLSKHRGRQLVEEQRIAMLENFDMEVEDKIRSMRVQLEADKADLLLKAECEIAQLPKCVREMPLKVFLDKYHGDVQAAVRGTLRLDGSTDDSLAKLPDTPLAIRSRRKKGKQSNR
ncbi:hypothetical protein GGI12_005193 [Dipsacomyces acuminosporus]|nr:hypothetical protein GGI12_005193 [Dipsacomyces acuminosporus]